MASLNRPVKMTNSAKAAVWTAVWQPRAPIGQAQRGRESAAPAKRRHTPSPAPPSPNSAINLVIPSPHRHLWQMDEFNYQVPAEVYASRGRGAAKRPMTFYRFASAAEAIRFVMEKLPVEMLHGTIMEIGETRFIGNEIKRLYGSQDYPLTRLLPV